MYLENDIFISVRRGNLNVAFILLKTESYGLKAINLILFLRSFHNKELIFGSEMQFFCFHLPATKKFVKNDI